MRLGTLGGESSGATGLNNLGQVVGWSETAEGESHAFFWDPITGMRDLGGLGGAFTRALGINDSGQVVGFAFTSEPRQVAFLWDDLHGMTELPSPGGAAEGRSINNAGVVVGTLGGRPVRWRPGEEPEDLGHVLAAAHPSRISENGAVVGDSDLPGQGLWMEAVRWNTDGTTTALGRFSDAGSAAHDANEAGEVVGYSAHGLWDALVAVLWTGQGEMVDLNAYATGGWSLSDAVGINARGDIVGQGHDGTYYQAFVLYRDAPAAVHPVEFPGAVADYRNPNSLRISPNPTPGPVRLAWENAAGGIARIEVFHPSGALVGSSSHLLPAGSVTVTDLALPGAAGLYFLRVHTASGTILEGRCLSLRR